jgi:hypothetical protein
MHYTVQTKKTIELFCCNIILEHHIKALKEERKDCYNDSKGIRQLTVKRA